VASEILREVATRLASYKVPEGLKVLDELPRNALSKVDRNALQAMVPTAEEVVGRLQMAAASRPPKQPDQRPARRVASNG
jgi:acyl-coenzyme A synthetase/AMP-(fatty) acid ligase